MSDLISREAAIDAVMEAVKEHGADQFGGVLLHYTGVKAILECLPSVHPGTDEWCPGCKEYDPDRHCCPRFNRVIKTALAEALPVRKGKWIECETSPHYKCSLCGNRAPMFWNGEVSGYSEWWSDFCPNCGARMSEGEEDD